MAEKLELKLEFEVCSEEELTAQDRNLIQRAREATSTSYAPYSNFNVGAAILLDDGSIVCGSNQENAAYPSGMCAERTALYYAGANNAGKKVRTIAIAARHASAQNFQTVAPCGSCRQAMAEYESQQKEPIRVIMFGSNNKVYISPSIENLLPFIFSKINLQGS